MNRELELRMALLSAASAQPWAMERTACDVLFRQLAHGALPSRMLAQAGAAGVAQAADAATTPEPEAAAMHPNTERALARKEGNVLVVPVHGLIAPRISLWDMLDGYTCTPPAYVANAVASGVADPDVKAVVLSFDSPGGLSGGVVEAWQRIMDLRGQGTPIIGQVVGQCASAAYWLASACDELNITPSGGAGSIGVYLYHEDWSEWFANAGIKPTYVEAPAGGNKTEGNDTEPLDEAAQAHLLEIVTDTYDQFVASVAKGRGVAESLVRSETFGQGRVYMAQRAVDRGLGDRVRAMHETLAAIGTPADPAPQGRGRSYALAAAQARLKGITL